MKCLSLFSPPLSSWFHHSGPDVSSRSRYSGEERLSEYQTSLHSSCDASRWITVSTRLFYRLKRGSFTGFGRLYLHSDRSSTSVSDSGAFYFLFSAYQPMWKTNTRHQFYQRRVESQLMSVREEELPAGGCRTRSENICSAVSFPFKRKTPWNEMIWIILYKASWHHCINGNIKSAFYF